MLEHNAEQVKEHVNVMGHVMLVLVARSVAKMGLLIGHRFS
jgi:hypothetical protein